MCSKYFQLKYYLRIPDVSGLFVTGDSQSGILRIWNVSKATPLENFQIKKKGFISLTVLKNSLKTQIVKYIDENGIIKNSNIENEQISNDISTDIIKSHNVLNYIIPKFKILATFSDGGTGLYDFSKKDWDFYKEQGHLETIFDCKFSNHDPNIVATASFDGTVKLWSISTAEVVSYSSKKKSPSLQK
jgi:WD40 repeat protein